MVVGKKPAPAETSNIQGANILVVDDRVTTSTTTDYNTRDSAGNPKIIVTEYYDGADSTAELLLMHGAKHVDIAHNNQEMMTQVRAKRPDLVITDTKPSKSQLLELERLGVGVVHHTGHDTDIRAVLDAKHDGTAVPPDIERDAKRTVLKGEGPDKLMAMVNKALAEGKSP